MRGVRDQGLDLSVEFEHVCMCLCVCVSVSGPLLVEDTRCIVSVCACGHLPVQSNSHDNALGERVRRAKYGRKTVPRRK